MRLAVHSINVEQYQSHWLHTREATWRQSNCYVDLWIEILSSLKLNPVASFGFTLNIDFEGDQWTFFKVPLADLYTLYGIDVQELTIWHAVLEHAKVAHRVCSNFAFVGWDLAFSSDGPMLLEGNANWSADEYQSLTGEPLGHTKFATVLAARLIHR